MEQLDEIYKLLTIIEKSVAHGTSFSYIRAAATARLQDINHSLSPSPPEEPPVQAAPEAEEPTDAA